MVKIIDIEGIGPTYARKLTDAGVRTTNALLSAAASRQGRENLAAKVGLNTTQILEFVNRADLFRVRGIGTQYSDLLEAAGVDSVAELATRRAENLVAKLQEINLSRRLVRQLPSPAMVQSWIDHAKKLPRMVTH